MMSKGLPVALLLALTAPVLAATPTATRSVGVIVDASAVPNAALFARFVDVMVETLASSRLWEPTVLTEEAALVRASGAPWPEGRGGWAAAEDLLRALLLATRLDDVLVVIPVPAATNTIHILWVQANRPSVKRLQLTTTGSGDVSYASLTRQLMARLEEGFDAASAATAAADATTPPPTPPTAPTTVAATGGQPQPAAAHQPAAATTPTVAPVTTAAAPPDLPKPATPTSTPTAEPTRQPAAPSTAGPTGTIDVPAPAKPATPATPPVPDKPATPPATPPAPDKPATPPATPPVPDKPATPPATPPAPDKPAAPPATTPAPEKPAATPATPPAPDKPTATPETATPLLEAADKYLREGDLERAEGLLLKAQEAGEPKARVCYAFSRLEAARHNLAAERSWLERSLAEDTANNPAHLRLAELLRGAGLWRKAMDEYNTVLKTEPANLHAYLGLSSIYAAQSQPRRAAEILTQAVKHHPEDVSLYLRLGDLYLQRSAFAEAEEAFDRAARLASGETRAEALDRLGDLYVQADRDHEGFICYAEASRLRSAGAARLAEKRYRQIMAAADESVRTSMDRAATALQAYLAGKDVYREDAFAAMSDFNGQIQEVSKFADSIVPPPQADLGHAQRRLAYSLAAEAALYGLRYLDQSTAADLATCQARLAESSRDLKALR